jgi:non-ribosomal peptide synthetase component F
LLEFPSNTITADGSSHEGATHNREISTSLVSALRLLARQSDATLFTVLLAAFNLVLRHLSGKQDIVVGTMIAGRPQRETERLIGFFINTLVLRNQLSGISSFGGLVSQSRRVVLEAMDNQDVPFDKVVKALRPERSLTHAPLFQVVFTLQNVPMPQMILPDMKLEVLEVSRGVVPFDLNLNLLERDDSITASLEYRAGRFDASAADRLLAQYELVLRMIVENPETTLEAIEESLVELDKQEWAEKEKELKAIREQKFRVARRRRVVSL